MVKSCAAINCTVRHNKGVKIKFHRFPKNPRLRELWLKAVTRANYRPSDFAVICQNHFREDDYVINVHGNTVLREGSVPSVFNFPHLPSIKEEKTILERTQNECGEDLPASDEMQIPGKEILVADRISATETATVTVSLRIQA
ncbi:hypothetical protein NQ315_000496 [Exocentrus adspersus]|uniref:THAP-type domain-containing protein n=1 Tax=Exocentrus adspersus TaxID=1586481 RepID=A0AAV8V599_9CUCU|nr:hypothetical protein NQ315_000496 [Exocentrus adspersus]